ncbi:MAG: hypothetical protein KAS93_02810 [Gammaproteobacteria bacterium]|nr:hypothetical protein [Gammaproteobacteria bacterium]
MRLLKICVVSMLLLFVVSPVVSAHITDADAQKIVIYNYNYQLDLLRQSSVRQLSHSIVVMNSLLHEKITNKSIVNRFLFKFVELGAAIGISQCSEAVSKKIEQDGDYKMLQLYLTSYYQASNAYQNLKLGFAPVLTADLNKLSNSQAKNIVQITGNTYLSQVNKVDLIASALATDFSSISSLSYDALKKRISDRLLANKRY